MGTEENTAKLTISEHDAGITFSVHLQPRSSKNEMCGLQGDALKIRLTSPPVDDAANRHLIEFISKTLEIPKSRVSIVSGTKSRHKKVQVEGVTADSIRLLF
jgi:uncharacterized protein (TIGR00251 family)